MSMVFDLKRAELERKHLLGAPIYYQFFLMRELKTSIKFTSYMIYFVEMGRLPDYLIHELSLWVEIADYWLLSDINSLSPEIEVKLLKVLAQCRAHEEIDLLDEQFDRFYHTLGKALVLAAKLSDSSLPALLSRVKGFSYQHYIKEALKVSSDYTDMLSKALMRNRKQSSFLFTS